MGILQEFKESIQDYVLGVINNDRQGKGVKFVRILLSVSSVIFGWLVQVRLKLYKSGIFRTKSLGCRIVSIGNITVGGTGKTPAVELFARELQKEGRKVAVISRGYRSSSRFRIKRFVKKLLLLIPKDKQIKVVSDGKKIYLNSYLGGDEPYMLAKNLPGVVVAVDKDRIKAGQYVIEKYGVDTIVLDDGFQYLSLNPRYDVVLIDSTNPFGNGHLLPRGILRESLDNLSRANLFMLTKVQPGQDLSLIKATIRQYNFKADFIECRHRAVSFVSIENGMEKPLSFIKNKRVGVVSAIADPAGFEKRVEELGGQVVGTCRFQDHHRFSVKELREIVEDFSSKDITVLISTEKDAVRFPKLSQNKSIQMYYLRVEMEILSGEEDFKNCISNLSFR
ncbi:MAG: tetraacyldisaccharide 4'-kinase [Candidatus Auribacterota bacterium]|nr:tetraacyldisaccharide 4'-kinase [Candidatus Auribacterota bacterium]